MKQFMKDNKKLLLVGIFTILLSIISVGFGIYMYINKKQTNPIQEIAFLKEDDNINQDNEEVLDSFYVEVKGAVKNPGVYEVKNGQLINDAIKMAGGIKSTAYTDNINMSKKATPEMVIYIYTKSAYNKLTENSNLCVPTITTDTKNDLSTATNTNVSNKNNISDIQSDVCQTPAATIDNCIDSGSSIIVPGESTEEGNNNSTETNCKININTASLEELQKISGVGESKAQKIISYRNENGKFKSIDDIKNVSGIGEAMYEKIKDSITV